MLAAEISANDATATIVAKPARSVVRRRVRPEMASVLPKQKHANLSAERSDRAISAVKVHSTTDAKSAATIERPRPTALAPTARRPARDNSPAPSAMPIDRWARLVTPKSTIASAASSGLRSFGTPLNTKTAARMSVRTP